MTAPSPSAKPSTPLRLVPLLAALAAWVLVLGASWYLVNANNERGIAHLYIEGDLQRVNPQAVELAIRKQLGERFVELQLDRVKAAAESLPWVARTRVERVWPSDLRVRLWEREAFARWGEAQLLDSQGQVFTPEASEIPPALPQLTGPPGHERDVMETFQQLSPLLAATPFALTGLARDARGDWSAQTQAGIGLRLGQREPQQKMQLLRGAVSTALRDRMHEVDYVDLRYTNGFAVGWKLTGENDG